MRMHTMTPASVFLMLLTTTMVASQQPEAPRRTTGGDSSSVTAVVVDLVVRDKRGLPVTNLAAGDFEVTEDGVPQADRIVPAADAGGPAHPRHRGRCRRDAGASPRRPPHHGDRGDWRITWRGVGRGARVRSPLARFAPVHQARRRPLHRQGQRERARGRHLRNRLGARGAAAIHARRRGTPGDAREGRHAHQFAGLRDAGRSPDRASNVRPRSRTRWPRSAPAHQPQVRRRVLPAPICRWRRCSSACRRPSRCWSATSRVTAR